jgi:hypothetical protein
VASKILTREQAQSRKDAAVRFAEKALDDPDKASDIESEDLDDWVERKRITLIDNTGKRRKMANGNGDPRTKAELLAEIEDLQSQLDAINDILNPPDDEDADYDADDDDDDDLG